METRHQIRWDNQCKTVVLQTYERDATPQDMYEMAAESAQMLNSVSNTVHLIIDQTAVVQMFTIGSDLMRYLNSHVPANQGVVLVVGAQMYAKTIARVGDKIAPNAFNQTHFFESADDARAYLAKEFEVRYP